MPKDQKAAQRRDPQSLGAYLANVRAAKRMTLREVEQATDAVVSNAYLSQLEHGKISQPSPNILHSIAAAYGVSYELLMEKAGYVTAANTTLTGKHGRIPTFADDDLTAEEQEELLKYLAFLRSQKGRK